MNLNLFFNTIENLYRNIYLIGNSNSIEVVGDYFRNNNSINTRKVMTVEEDNHYLVLDDTENDCIFVVAEEYDIKIVRTSKHTEGVAVFISEIKNGVISIKNSNGDIDGVIIPTLIDNGVKVLRVRTPNIDGIKQQQRRRVVFRNKMWTKIRLVFPRQFNNLRHLIRGTSYIKSDQKKLTNDNSKGYSVMYGNTKYINFDDGFRRTIGTPDTANNSIYIFGPCFIRGLSSEDKYTIPSMLQEDFPEYKVCNYGSEFGTINLIMRIPYYKKGDIVVFFENINNDNYVGDNNKICEQLDLTDTYNKIPGLYKHVFDDLNHYDMYVQKYVVMDLALKLRGMTFNQENLEKNNNRTFCFGAIVKRAANLNIFRHEDDGSMMSWLNMVNCELHKKTKRATNGATNIRHERGAIVMNCNPFTCGHRYLIEMASKEVKELLIFVLCEDSSYFKFEDRIEMVRQGVADLKNVFVFSSGKYMISAETLPGYFNKVELCNTIVDMSNDLELFTRIAETLNISVRFAGSEPLDPFTKRYNDKMNEFLPKYGIEFKEVERKMFEDSTISASLVRKYIKEKKYDEIKKIVPKSTYKIIKEKYSVI